MNTVKRFTLLILLLTFIASPVLEAYFDPHIGRFTQRDPMKDGVNHYVYAYNNPLAFIDPTGLRPLSGLESYAVNSVFAGSISPDELDLTIERLFDSRGKPLRGQYLEFRDGKHRIAVNPDYYAGLSAGATTSDAFDSNGSLRSDVTGALGLLIHETAHAWQRKYNLFREQSPWREPLPKGRQHYGFNTLELTTLNLGSEQHASAVQSYFHIQWQLAWGRTAVDLSMEQRSDALHGRQLSVAGAQSSLAWYNNLISRIRTPLPPTWGGIKTQ